MNLSGQLITGTGSYEVKEIAPPIESGQLFDNNEFENNIDDWNAQASWTWDNGQAFYDGVGSSHYILQSKLTTGRWYHVTLDVALNPIGFTLQFGGGSISITEDGIINITAQAVGANLIIRGNTGSLVRINSAILEEVPEGYPLMDKGTKYLECTANGTVAFPSDQAYGTWEFDLYKGADANSVDISFISDVLIPGVSSGYFIRLQNDQSIDLREYVGGSGSVKFTTAASYIDSEVWYRIKITRTLDGEFTVEIMGGAFGVDDWMLVDVSGGSGTNPIIDNTFVASIYFVLAIDGGDRIANLITYNAVKQ